MQSTEETPPEDEVICRICHETSPSHHMLSPCACSGTIRYVHNECLLEWLRHAHGSSLSNALECRVCRQPFSVTVPGICSYLSMIIRETWARRGANISDSLTEFGVHLVREPACSHPICMWLRLGLALACLQICVWEGQALLLFAFTFLRIVMRFDAVLDEILIPASLLETFYILMPPLCEVGPATIGLQASRLLSPPPPPPPPPRRPHPVVDMLCRTLRLTPLRAASAFACPGTPPRVVPLPPPPLRTLNWGILLYNATSADLRGALGDLSQVGSGSDLGRIWAGSELDLV